MRWDRNATAAVGEFDGPDDPPGQSLLGKGVTTSGPSVADEQRVRPADPGRQLEVVPQRPHRA